MKPYTRFDVGFDLNITRMLSKSVVVSRERLKATIEATEQTEQALFAAQKTEGLLRDLLEVRGTRIKELKKKLEVKR